MKTPNADALRLAADWLRCYEPLDGDDDLTDVANWLDSQADSKELRNIARQLGVPVGIVATIAKTAA